MKKIVISTNDYFGLSAKAVKRIAELKSMDIFFYMESPDKDGTFLKIKVEYADNNNRFFEFHCASVDLGDKTTSDELDKHCLYIEKQLETNRDDPDMIQAIEELGEESYCYYCGLKIIQIPDDVDWQIECDEFHEWVAEKHRKWS